MHPNLMDSTHPHTILSKLNEQRSQGLFCDVTIVVEDVKFRAHKNILAACSGYFRSTLTPSDTCSSSQVLELMDLKSEVFASILNFIYSSKVTLLGAENRGGLAAAGRRLGIPFLEKLTEEDQQDDCVKSRGSCATTKFSATTKGASRPEETDSARGPRITNAFSITEMCPGNNPFTPLAQIDKQRQSPDVGQLPSSFPTMSCINGNNETTHTLSEHSYAVNNPTEGKDTGQWDNRKVCKPPILHSKTLIYRNTGPLKKRHRLRGLLGKSILPAPADQQTDEANIVAPASSDGHTAGPTTVMTPPALFSEAETENTTETAISPSTDSVNTELGPPPLSPHPEDSISVYSCEHCPEMFSNKALLTIHSDLHKKHFGTHLFCKFCHRKFIHLKRLYNHEKVCPKAGRGPSKLDAREISAQEVEHHLDDRSNTENSATQSLSADVSSPNMTELIEVNLTERLHEEKTVRQRRYSCSVCKRVYVTLSSLRRHENVHSWQRAYPCHYCNKVFALAEYRTKHEIWHTGERRYQCIFCLETFMTYYILKNHQKSFHGIDPSLAVRKKSANGGLKASVYPIKLYRLLPMKFRKRQYKTYSQTYSESVEKGDSSSLENSSLIPPFEENSLINHPETTTFPLTFMATTTMVSPVMPRICFDKPCDKAIDQTFNSEQRNIEKEAGGRDPLLNNCDVIFSVMPNSEPPANKPPVLINTEGITHNTPYFNSLSTVKKLGELSASAKRVEEMTKEILQSSAEDLRRDKVVGSKTETYIAKPACQGPSLDSDAKPLCQITVKIGNEAIIRRKIKGSKLFPRKKRKTREINEEQSLNQCSPLRENPQSPRLRLRPEAIASSETYDETNDCDTADQLWRPYYSYKAKKKRKKFRLKHRNALFHPGAELSVDRTGLTEPNFERIQFPTEESSSGGSTGLKHSLSKNYSPRPTYNCDICDSSFITETGLKAHIIGSHPYFCRTCGKQGPPGEAPTVGDYICNSCMENGSCFDNTPRSPNQEKKYRCSFCPQRFLYLATKRSHEKKHQETNNENPKYDTFSSSAQPREGTKQDTTKREDSGNQGSIDIKCENTDEEDFASNETEPKIKETSDLISSTPYPEVSYSSKSPPSRYIDSLSTLSPAKMRLKVVKKKISMHHSMHHIPKKQAYDRDSDPKKKSLTGTRMKSLTNHEKPSKLFRKTDSESNGANHLISLHKPEKWVCKEESFF